jgi:signal transduction histidine kinase
VSRFSGAVAASLRSMLSPVGREIAELRTLASNPRKSSPDLESAARMDVDERLEQIRRKLLAVQEFVAELAAVGENDPHELVREVDLADVARAEVRALEARAQRGGVEVVLRVGADDGGRAPARVASRAISVLMRSLVAHALSATAKGSAVLVTVSGPVADGADARGARVVVDDAGTILPAAARRALLQLEVEPGTFGRPSSIGLFVAAEIAAAQGALLEIGDAPVEAGRGGGVRVTVTFPR